MKILVPFGIVGLLVFVPAASFAQQAPKVTTEIKKATFDAAFARALQELKPGVTISDHFAGLEDMGKYNIGVAVVARPAGTFAGALEHGKITEIYYILKGSGTSVTGEMVDGTEGANVSGLIGPSRRSNSPLKSARTQKLSAGDVQIIPPGVGHTFTSIDPGGIEYLVFRVDPEHVLNNK